MVRDFIENWYSQPAVSTGDPQFLVLARSLLSRFVANAHDRIKTKNGREVAVYLLGCVSMTVVRELDESVPVASASTLGATRGRDNSPTAIEARAARRRRQTKTVAEELVLTCMPPGVANLGLTRSLLTEMLSVQLENTVRGIGDDWINQTIIATLGSPSTAAAPDASARDPARNDETSGSRNDPAASPVPQALKDMVEEVGEAVEEAVKEAGQLERDDTGFRIPTSSDGLLSTYLDDPSRPALDPLLSALTALSPWEPSSHSRDSLLPSLLSHTPVDEDLASSLAGFVDRSPRSAALVRLWTQLGSFAAVMKGTTAVPEVRREDARSVLRRVRDIIGLLVGDNSGGSDEVKEEELKRVLGATIRSIEREVPGDTTFDTLQAWLIEELERGEVGRWIRNQQQRLADRATSPRSSPRSSRAPRQAPAPAANNPTAPSMWTEWVARMEMPHIEPSEGAAGELSTPPPEQPSIADYDFSAMMRPTETRNPGQSAATQRAGSFSRTARSPPASELGSPIAPRDPPARPTTKTALTHRHPEEGDMAEGLSRSDEERSPRPSFESSKSASSASAFPSHAASNRVESPRPRAESSASGSSVSTMGGAAEIPPFSVSVTDISLPTAWDAKGQVRLKRDLEFIIAVEAQGVPGFIVTRKWTEVEKMDADVHRSLQAGTLDFPRALLPSLAYKTTDSLCKGLEAYLESLLREPRYASSQPVLRFFAKERAGSAQDLNIWAIGRGVSNLGTAVGEGVNKGFAVPANLASQGFNQISKGFGLPFGATKKRPSSQQLPANALASPKGTATKPLPRADSDTTSPVVTSSHGSSSSLSLPQQSQHMPAKPPDSAELASLPTSNSPQKISAPLPPTPVPIDVPSPVTPVAPSNAPVSAKGYDIEESPPPPPKPRYAVHKPRRSLDVSARSGPAPSAPPAALSASSSSSSLSRIATAQASPPKAPPKGKGPSPPRSSTDAPSLLAFEAPSGLQALTKPAGKLFGAIGSVVESIAPIDAGADGSFESLDTSRFPSRRSSATLAPAPASRPPKAGQPAGSCPTSPVSSRTAQPLGPPRTSDGKASLPSKPPTADEPRVKSEAAIPRPIQLTSDARVSALTKETAAAPPPPLARPKQPTTLTQHDFDNIVVSAMSVLEAAYGLTGQWSMKRGVFRVLETVLRTSYSGAIKASVSTLIDSASDADIIASRLDGMRASFWPGDIWWSAAPSHTRVERTLEEKAQTRQEARRLFVGSWDSLKLALGAGGESRVHTVCCALGLTAILQSHDASCRSAFRHLAGRRCYDSRSRHCARPRPASHPLVTSAARYSSNCFCIPHGYQCSDAVSTCVYRVGRRETYTCVLLLRLDHPTALILH